MQDNIRSVVLVHRPASLDAACSLALLQEEVLLDIPSKDGKRQDGGSSTRSSYARVSYSPMSPSRAMARTNSTGAQKPTEPSKPSGLEDKLQNIKSYRRAKGLCFKYDDKWNPTHKCSTTVALNPVEELWQLLPKEEEIS